MRITILFVFIFISRISSQIAFEGNDFNLKQLLILNSDSTFVYKILGRDCNTYHPTLLEISGNFTKTDKQIILNNKKIIESIVYFNTDSLNIKSDSLNFYKKIKSESDIKKSEKLVFNITKYKNYTFLINGLDSKTNNVKDEFLKFADLFMRDEKDLDYYMKSKLHIIENQNFDKKTLISFVPKEYKNFFLEEPLNFNIIEFKIREYPDKNMMPENNDISLLYDYKIILDKGKKDKVYVGMQVYPQKDIQNCYDSFTVYKVLKNTSEAKITIGNKCELKDNSFSTKRKILN